MQLRERYKNGSKEWMCLLADSMQEILVAAMLEEAGHHVLAEVIKVKYLDKKK